MKASMRGLTSCSSSSLDAAVTMKSSAYRTKLTLAAIPLIVVFGKRSRNLLSRPSSVMLASTGEMMPPWGVPSSVGCRTWFSIYPACNHFLKMALSMGMWVTSHACEMASKQPLMSPSSIHCAEWMFPSAVKHCSIASAVDLCGRKPYEFGSAVVSATGSRASKYSACIALSSIQGIPKGRFLPFFLGI